MSSAITDTREIRVFLSSTFADMQAERDYLVKKIFPAIRSECHRRNVDFTVLDLRWGITEEEAKSGKVIEICMDEISRTRPFFIGLIGGRYGWIPKENDGNLDERLFNRYPHVREGISKGKSITEMEMLYGVLEYPERTYSHFFIRSLRSVPKKFLDKKGSEEAIKRDKLKEAVRTAASKGKCSVSDYSTIKQLGKMVSEALMNTLDTLYPATAELSRFDLIMSNHDAAISRLRKIYVPQTATIGDSIVDDEDIVYIFGAKAGSGKSAWAANYWKNGLTQSPAGKRYIAVHTMLGSEINSAEMCRRALAYGLCKNISGLEMPDLNIPDEQTVDIFPLLDRLDSELGIKLVWIIDGVEKLQNKTDRNLLWLNGIIKSECIIVLLGSDEDQLNEFASSRMDCSFNEVVPMSETQKMSLTSVYLRNFAKGLTVSQRASIANAPQLGNPGTLRIFLNELLQYGVYENLDGFMAGYIDTPDMKSFLNVVLTRVDGDFDPKTISNYMNLLRLSFYGVQEEDVIDFLQLKPVEWAAVQNALEEFTETTNGKLKLKSGDFTDVVAEHYPLSAAEEKRIRNSILGYSRKRFNVLKKESEKAVIAKEGYFTIMCSVLFIGLSLDFDSISPSISAHFAEMFRQEIALKQFKKAVTLLDFSKFAFAGSYQQTIFNELHILKENNVSLSGIVSCRALLFSALAEDNIMLTFYKSYICAFGTEKDFRSVNRKIKLLPVFKSAKKKLLDYWNDNEESLDFIDLWDENDFIDSMSGLVSRNSDLFTIYDIDQIKLIHQKLLRTVSNLSERDLKKLVGGILYCDLAITSARLEEFEEADRYIQLLKQCENVPIGYPEFAKLYVDCLRPEQNRTFRQVDKDYEKLEDAMRSVLMDKSYLEYIGETIAFPNDTERIKANVAEAYQRTKSGDKVLGAAAQGIGNILYVFKKWEGAIAAYDEFGRLTDVDSDKTFASYRAGRSAFDLEDYSTAIKFLKLNIEHIRTFTGLKDWDENITLRYLFKSYLASGMVDEGIAAAEEMIANRIKSNVKKDVLSADYNSLAVRLSIIADRFSGEEYERLLEKIIGYYKKALECEPDDRIIQFNLLTTYRQLFDKDIMPEKEYLKYLRQFEDLYHANVKANDTEQINYCANQLALAYYKLERWDDAIEMVEKHDGEDFLTQYDFLRAKIMTGNPEHRKSVVVMIFDFISSQSLINKEYLWNRMKTQLLTISRYISDFAIEEDLINVAEEIENRKQEYESLIVCTNFVAIKNKSERMADLSRRLLANYLSIYSAGEFELRLIAKSLLLPECDKPTQEKEDAKLAELRQFFIDNVGSAEEFEIRQLENIDLFELRKPETMTDFIKKISGKPWFNRVLEKIMNRLHESKSVNMFFREYFEPLAPLLKKGIANDHVLHILDDILDNVSSSDYGRDNSDILYPMYLGAGLTPSSLAVLFYMEYIEDSDGIDAAIRFYNDTDAGEKYGLEYAFATMIRSAGRLAEAEEIVDKHLTDKDDNYKYWVFEKVRLCRSRGDFREGAEYFLTIPEEDVDDDYINNTNLWVVACVFTYAGMHEKALAYLERAAEYNEGDYETGFPEYDPDFFGDQETGELLNDGELDLFYDVLLRSVIYFRMGNEKLGFESFRTWEEVTEKLIENNVKEISLVSLRELELCALMERRGDRQKADYHYKRACDLLEKADKSSFCHAVKKNFDLNRNNS